MTKVLSNVIPVILLLAMLSIAFLHPDMAPQRLLINFWPQYLVLLAISLAWFAGVK